MKAKSRIIFFGCTSFSEQVLSFLLEHDWVEVASVFTIPEKFQISYNKEGVKNYNYSDIGTLASKNEIPVYIVEKEKGSTISSYT